MSATEETVIAHHDYEAQQDDELSFRSGDAIVVLDHSNTDWWQGKKQDGTIGFFPSNFVEAPSVPESAVAEEPSSPQEPEAPSVIGVVRVMEDYAMQEANELTLHKGTIVNITERLDNGWYSGEINGKHGRFPAQVKASNGERGVCVCALKLIPMRPKKYVEEIDMPGGGGAGVGMSRGDGARDNAPPGGFRLAAFGVKQGGIGSLLAGGFPALKKTGSAVPAQEKSPVATTPSPPAASPEATVAPVLGDSPKEDSPKDVISPKADQPEAVCRAIVLHAYDAENEDELSLVRGEHIEVLDRQADDGWWKGRNERNEVGVFPQNFVAEVDQEAPAVAPTRARKSIDAGKTPSPAPAAVDAEIDENQENQEKDANPQADAPTSEPDHVAEQEHVDVVDEDAKPVSPKAEKDASDAEVAATVEPTSESDAPATNSAAKEDIEDVPEVTSTTMSASDVQSDKIAAESPAVAATSASSPESDAIVKTTPSEASPSPAEDAADEPVPEQETDAATKDVSNDDQPERAESAPTEAIVPPTYEAGDAAEPEKKDAIDLTSAMPSTGPRLASPARVTRPTRSGPSRRPMTKKEEGPSQSELLQREVETAPEPETPNEEAAPESASSPTGATPPPKPVKPIFAKFPTPFAGGAEISTKHLKPVQRRMFEPVAAHESSVVDDKKQDENTPPRPTGVKGLASRFAGVPTSSGNEVLETKLKNFTKNEVDKLKKEFEKQLEEERAKRAQLEDLVQSLVARIDQLQPL
ncbi:hypothetical protein BC940DRAFT_292595 [Gongronella butleri]|nr:hypothetical protein BC940DRAFT_292595 [Gongronella butleri]